MSWRRCRGTTCVRYPRWGGRSEHTRAHTLTPATGLRRHPERAHRIASGVRIGRPAGRPLGRLSLRRGGRACPARGGDHGLRGGRGIVLGGVRLSESVCVAAGPRVARGAGLAFPSEGLAAPLAATKEAFPQRGRETSARTFHAPPATVLIGDCSLIVLPSTLLRPIVSATQKAGGASHFGLKSVRADVRQAFSTSAARRTSSAASSRSSPPVRPRRRAGPAGSRDRRLRTRFPPRSRRPAARPRTPRRAPGADPQSRRRGGGRGPGGTPRAGRRPGRVAAQLGGLCDAERYQALGQGALEWTFPTDDQAPPPVGGTQPGKHVGEEQGILLLLEAADTDRGQLALPPGEWPGELHPPLSQIPVLNVVARRW